MSGLRTTLGAYGQGNFLSDWDEAGRQTRVTNARGKTATLTDDDAGKVIRRNYANGGYSTLDYNDAGNLTLVTNAGAGGAATLAYAYDKANRKTRSPRGLGHPLELRQHVPGQQAPRDRGRGDLVRHL